MHRLKRQSSERASLPFPTHRPIPTPTPRPPTPPHILRAVLSSLRRTGSRQSCRAFWEVPSEEIEAKQSSPSSLSRLAALPLSLPTLPLGARLSSESPVLDPHRRHRRPQVGSPGLGLRGLRRRLSEGEEGLCALMLSSGPGLTQRGGRSWDRKPHLPELRSNLGASTV